jgi:GDP-4-dehydro-6-deoxy-D-mannose reductase
VNRSLLVTGATGFAGSHLLDLLADEGAPLAAWCRPGGQPPGEGATHIRWTAVDLLDRDAVARAIGALRPAVVYHCAGAANVGHSWERPRPTLELNVLGTHHLIEAIRRGAPDARVLIPGSALVYRPAARALTEDDATCPQTPYGVSKLAQEMVGARAAAIDGVAALLPRAFNHIGPRQASGYAASGFAQQIARIEAGAQPATIAVGNLDAARDLTDVRDTVRAYRLIAASGRPGRVYNVCSGRAVRIGDLLDALLARARVKIAVRVDPDRLRPTDNPVVLGDPSRLRAETGWAPRIPIEQTLQDLLAYWRESLSERARIH